MTRARRIIATTVAAMLTHPVVARASDRSEGKDLEDRLPLVATVEGPWSTTLTTGLLASGRLLSGPIGNGLLDAALTRVLYGSTFSVTLVMVGATTEAIAGSWDWLERADYRTSWLVGYDVPAPCAALGVPAGCGLGLGTSSAVRGMWALRPIGLGLTMGAEWIQGRVDRDGTRTLVESSWVLSPIGVRAEVPFGGDEVEAVPGLGVGLYGGLHDAHLHAEPDVDYALTESAFELVPLEGGVGPGGTADLAVTFGGALRLEGSVTLAPLLAGGGRDTPVPFAAILNAPNPDGLVVWRQASASITVRPPGFPMWIGARYWAGELSRRELLRAGHRALGFTFDVPLREERDH